MTTISERLRAASSAMNDIFDDGEAASLDDADLMDEAAVAIDAMRDALTRAQEQLREAQEFYGKSTVPGLWPSATLVVMDAIDAALALARKGG